MAWAARPSSSARPRLGPRAIHLEPEHQRVHQRPRETGVVEQVEEALLELAPRDGGAGSAQGERRANRRRPGAARVAVEEGGKREPVGETQVIRLVESPLDLAGVEHGGEVEERARDGRDGDAVEDGGLVGGKADSVEAHPASMPPVPGHGHVHHRSAARAKAPESGGGTVAQRRARTACKYGSEPPTLACDGNMPHRVDTSVQIVEATAPAVPVDLVTSEPETCELSPGNHTVLSCREGRNGLITRHVDRLHGSTSPGPIPPPIAGRVLRVGALVLR